MATAAPDSTVFTDRSDIGMTRFAVLTMLGLRRERSAFPLAVIEDLKTGSSQSRSPDDPATHVPVHLCIKHTYEAKMTPREKWLTAFSVDSFRLAKPVIPVPTNALLDGEYSPSGKVMSKTADRLRTFYLTITEERLVLEFDPSLPPEPGVSNKGGFAFRDRSRRRRPPDPGEMSSRNLTRRRTRDLAVPATRP